MAVVTDENDNLVPVKEEVVFEPVIQADDEFVVTDSADAEDVIKSTLNTLDVADGKEAKYPDKETISVGAKAMKSLNKNLNDIALGQDEDSKEASDGSTASYYDLPDNATSIQSLISFKNMNAQMGEIFRAVYRYGQVAHSEKIRDAKKIKFYIEAEIERLEKYGE